MKSIQSILLGALLLLLTPASLFADQYSDLLKKQGYKVMKTPRSEFGTGTIIGKVGNDKEALIAAPSQCFPDATIINQQLELLDRHQEKGLGIDAGANFLPGGKGLLSTITAAFGFSKVNSIDVSFGKTTGSEWTVVAFANYLDGKTISKNCYNQLIKDSSKVLLSTAKVEDMTYTFNGKLKVNPTVNVALLDSALKANGAVNYTSNSKDTLTVSSPMYIAYKAYRFKDLGLDVSESTDVPVRLDKAKFKLVPVK